MILSKVPHILWSLAGFLCVLVSSNSKPGIHIAWKTVTYRSVALLVLAVLLVIFVGMRFAFPQFTESGIKAADSLGTKLLEVVAGPREILRSRAAPERSRRTSRRSTARCG